MTGHNNLCGDGTALDATIAPVCGKQDLRKTSNGAEDFGSFIVGRNPIKEQDVANLASLHKFHKAYLSSGFPLHKVQVNAGLNSGDASSAMPIASSGSRQGNVDLGSSRVPDMEPGITEHAQGNVDLALSIEPYTEPATTECMRGIADFAGSCISHENPVPTVSRHLTCPTILSSPDLEPDTSMLNYQSRQPTSAGFSPVSNIHRYAYDLCLAQPAHHNDCLDNLVSHNSATRGECLAQPSTGNQAPDDVCLDNFITHGRATRELSFSTPLSTAGTKIGDKKQLTGLPLPDSLARSFDSSEMDKITKAIVRVNEFGSSLATNSASKQGNMPAFVQELGDGREVGSLKRIAPRVLPSIGAFTVQCAKCFKWRLVPSKEQYEQIRQYILEKPFFCSSTSIWQPGASCDDPPELCEDKNFVWAIDKPNIPLAPSGWERLLVIRSEGCSKFADIYYVAPSGKKLRSMPDIERYLSEHPELVNAGVSLSQFSFVIPRALDENYCRKKVPSTVMRGCITHKSTPAYNLGVRSQPFKVPYARRFPAEHLDLTDSADQPLECMQPATVQSSLNCPANAPLVIEPLRAWDPDNHAMMVACHAGAVLESPANAG